jgi:hypothetical protein
MIHVIVSLFSCHYGVNDWCGNEESCSGSVQLVSFARVGEFSLFPYWPLPHTLHFLLTFSLLFSPHLICFFLVWMSPDRSSFVWMAFVICSTAVMLLFITYFTQDAIHTAMQEVDTSSARFRNTPPQKKSLPL